MALNVNMPEVDNNFLNIAEVQTPSITQAQVDNEVLGIPVRTYGDDSTRTRLENIRTESKEGFDRLNINAPWTFKKVAEREDL